ncbi:MAG: hypothetical protein H3C28_08685 [Sphingomonadales bacterium]|nr:hypothetical protein [Sphingomonadales bacterium]
MLRSEVCDRHRFDENPAVGSFFRIKTSSLPGGLQNRQALPAMKRGAAVSE